MTTIPLTSINEGDRARKDYGNLEGLKASLLKLGSIHPIVLSKESDGSHRLVAGGRRLRAFREAGFSEVTHGSILEPGTVGFLYREEVPLDVLKEAELDENLYRLKPKWSEDALLIAEVHELKKHKEHKWGYRQTADLLGPGYGFTSVGNAVRLAKYIRSGDENILACSNMTDALAVLTERCESEALAEMNARNAERIKLGGTSLESFLDTLTISLGPKKSPVLVAKSAIEGGRGQGPVIDQTEGSSPSTGAPVIIPLSRMFICCDSIIGMSELPANSFDHVVTDIPYGIDMDNMDTRDMSSVAAEHDVKQNVSMMEPFLAQSFRLVKSGGFCVFFYDLDWHEYLQSTAEAIGWKVQRWPLIAHKTSACQNNAAQYNFTKNYECAMVLRRDEKTVLRSQQPTSIWTGDFAAERRLYNNPFAKPFVLWKWIYDAIAFTGQTVFDPYAGECSTGSAAVNCGLIPYGMEINEKHYLRGMERMKAVYALMHKANVEFV